MTAAVQILLSLDSRSASAGADIGPDMPGRYREATLRVAKESERRPRTRNPAS
jgi:hypothetical protein